MVNDPSLVALLRVAGESLLGDASVEEIPRPSMGGEDFSFYLRHVPGAMFRLGTASSERCAGLHTPTFDVDEEAIRLGSKVLARAVVYLADPDRNRRIEANQASGVW